MASQTSGVDGLARLGALAQDLGFVLKNHRGLGPHLTGLVLALDTRKAMKAVIYRPKQLEGHKSWRPRSLTDMRGPVFPDEYLELLVLDANSVNHAEEQYSSQLGDIVFLGGAEEEVAYVAAPFGWELVKFGQNWRSP